MTQHKCHNCVIFTFSLLFFDYCVFCYKIYLDLILNAGLILLTFIGPVIFWLIAVIHSIVTFNILSKVLAVFYIHLKESFDFILKISFLKDTLLNRCENAVWSNIILLDHKLFCRRHQPDEINVKISVFYQKLLYVNEWLIALRYTQASNLALREEKLVDFELSSLSVTGL